jgi:hypothetical protein
MTLDQLDHAFLDRWRALPAMPATSVRSKADASLAGPLTSPASTHAVMSHALTEVADDPVDRLLESARSEWHSLADVVEAARGRGRRVIAIVSCDRGAGASTLVAGLVRLLRRRGRDVVEGVRHEPSFGGATNDRRIVIIDGGVWFPPGRIHRQRVAVASAGCDAAILVRPAEREPPAAWSSVLEALSVEPLGEVVALASSPSAADGTTT